MNNQQSTKPRTTNDNGHPTMTNVNEHDGTAKFNDRPSMQTIGVHCCCARIRLLPGHKQSTTDMYPLFITGSGLAHDGQLTHSPICEPEMDASKIQPDGQERTKQRRPKI